jgi:hypothetical protein
VIELVANRLSPSERARWHAIVEGSPLAARIWFADPAIRALGALVCSAAFLDSFEGAGHGSLVTLVRLVGLGVVTFATASTLESLRAGASPWPNGRFVLAWGYVEIENGVLRAIPRSELTHEIRGRWLGVGRVRLRLRAGRWTTQMAIEPREAERIVTAWAEHAEDPPRAATGYREPARPRELTSGPPPRWTAPSFLGRLALALVVAPLALLFSPPIEPSRTTAQVAPIASAPVVDLRRGDYTDHFAEALRSVPEADLSVDLARCTPSQMMLGTIDSYLTLGLERRHLGPADLGAIPSFSRAAETPARIWARCTWVVDPETGMFDRVEARWGLRRDGASRLERRATIDVGDVTGALASCTDGRSLSPRALARVSLTLTTLVIEHDIYGAAGAGRVFDEGEGVADRDSGQCASRHAIAVPVRSVEPGSSS